MTINENDTILLNEGEFQMNNPNMNYDSSENKKCNNDNLKEIIRLKKIIEEKDSIIFELHSKLKEFRKDIDLLKNKMIYISENTQESLFLQIQTAQRFQIFPNQNNFNLNKSNKKFQDIDLSINYLNKYFNDLENNLNNEINNKTYLKLTPYRNFEYNNKNYNYSDNNFYKKEAINKNDINNIKYNSSLFFKKCKALMNSEDYLELLRIIKLFNSKKISKSETYEQITNYLEKVNYELLKDFYNLFIQ